MKTRSKKRKEMEEEKVEDISNNIKKIDKKNNNLKIIPIRPEESAKRKDLKELHPNLPNIYKGQLLALVAPIFSSKSTTWNNLIHNENFFKDMFSDVYIISNTIATDATSRFSYKQYKHTCYEIYNDNIIKDIVKNQKSKIENDLPDTSYALILDDLLGQFPKNGRKGAAAIHFSTRFRHYVKPNSGDPCMVLFSTQRYFDLSRIVRNNCTGLLLSGNIKSKKEWESIMEDYADVFGGKKKFQEMIKIVQAQPFTWLYLKMDTKPPTALMNFTDQLYP
jgi:hypothetical protein